MKKWVQIIASLVVSLSAQNLFAAANAAVDVTLFPAGDFTATTTKVEGFAVKKGDAFEAENVRVDLRPLKTGNKMRDNHTQNYLNTKSHPYAKLVKAKGSKGKGVAEIEIKGKRNKVEGTYEVKGSEIAATFPIKFSQFDIKDVNYMGVGVEDDGKVRVTLPIRAGK